MRCVQSTLNGRRNSHRKFTFAKLLLLKNKPLEPEERDEICSSYFFTVGHDFFSVMTPFSHKISLLFFRLTDGTPFPFLSSPIAFLLPPSEKCQNRAIAQEKTRRFFVAYRLILPLLDYIGLPPVRYKPKIALPC